MYEPFELPEQMSPNNSFESLGNDMELKSIPIDMDFSDDNSSTSGHHSQRDSPDLCENHYFNFEIEAVDFVQPPDVSANHTASFHNTPGSSLHNTGTSSMNDSKLGRNISLSISQDELANSIDRSSNPVNASLPKGTRTRSRRNMREWGKAVTCSKNPSKNRRILNETMDQTPQEFSYFNSFYPKLIGAGHFANTYEVDSEEFGRHAIKKLLQGNKKFYIEKDVYNHETLGKHPNVVEFYRAFFEDSTLFIQMELCRFSCKSLQVFFTSCNENCNSQWLLLHDCCKGLFHLHSHKVVHLDVKPDNILLGSDWNFKLCDFGCSAKNKEEFVSGEHVDGDYAAPELSGNTVTNGSDVYALGACIWSLSNKVVYKKDKDLVDVVCKMSHLDYGCRPNASDILKMEVVANKDIVQFRSDIQATLEDAMERNSKPTEQTPNRKAFYKILGQNNYTSTPKPNMSPVPKKLFN